MRLIFITLFKLIFLFQGLSQLNIVPDTMPPRPKVGLVLSGGAAHGFSHIGVIKYLEEQGIPIDYITGTSMGAVVGALYAMGYTSDEILRISKEQEWNEIISNSVPLRDIIITEKNEHHKIPYYIIWNGNKFDLPKGFLAGQKMDLILNRIYSPAHFVNDFDSLPIPFRCIAVDIAEGRVHTFTSGYLGQSVRASMAIPSVFPPMEIDDHLYVDGGLIRNFPVQENLEMGADIIIGSYVGSKRKSKEDLKSLVDILRQSTSMMNMLDSEEQSKMVDVFIAPDLEKYSYFDFDKIDLFHKLGYKEAIKNSIGIKEVKNAIKTSSNPEPVEKLQTPDLIKITNIVFHTNDKLTQEMIKGKLGFEVGEEVSLNTIENGISDVFGLNYFEKVSYDFFPYEDGIGLELASESSAPIKLGISFNRFQYYSPSLIFNAGLRNVLGKPTRLHSSSRISTNPGTDLIFQYRFWKDPDWLLQTKFTIESFQLPFFSERDLDRTYRQWSGHASLKFLKEIHKNALFGFGYAYNYHRINPQIVKKVDISKLKVKLHSYTFEYAYNSANRQSFPTDGWNIKFNASHDFIVNQSQSQKSDILFLENLPDNNNVSVSLMAESFNRMSKSISWHNWISLAYNSDEIFLDNFRIGGPNVNKNTTRGFIGINDSELIVGSHVLLGSKLQIRLKDFLYLNPVINLLIADDYLKYAYPVDERLKVAGFGLELAFKTPIGPLIFDLGYSSLGKRPSTNLGVGYRHIL